MWTERSRYTPTIEPGATPSALPSLNLSGNAQQLIAEANSHYQAAQDALKAGDLGKYQTEMNIVGQILNQLGQSLGTPAPSPSK